MILPRTNRPVRIVIVLGLLVLSALALAVMVNRWVAERLVALVPRAPASTTLTRGSARTEPAAEYVNPGDAGDAGIAIRAATDDERGTGTGRGKPKRRRTHSASADARDDATADIRAQSGTKFSIRRSFLARVLADPIRSLRSARVFPVQAEGQPSGLMLQGLGPEHVLRSLGLQNGDVLRSINGYSIATPDSALDAYAKLRGSAQFALLVLRSGRPVRFDYTIVESE